MGKCFYLRESLRYRKNLSKFSSQFGESMLSTQYILYVFNESKIKFSRIKKNAITLLTLWNIKLSYYFMQIFIPVEETALDLESHTFIYYITVNIMEIKTLDAIECIC